MVYLKYDLMVGYHENNNMADAFDAFKNLRDLSMDEIHDVFKEDFLDVCSLPQIYSSVPC